MKTLKEQFYLISQEKERFYNVRETGDSTKKGSVPNVHRKVRYQYHSSGLSLQPCHSVPKDSQTVKKQKNTNKKKATQAVLLV